MTTIEGGTRYQTLGTLSEPGEGKTCSWDVAERWGRAERLVPFQTFEAAAEAVKKGDLSAFLVPAAYPRLNHFIMDGELTAMESFIMSIAPLVLVGLDPEEPVEASVIYHHPATTPLLAAVTIPYRADECVRSNPAACLAVLEARGQALAITNGFSASHYQLQTHAVLRPSIEMPFICFSRARP